MEKPPSTKSKNNNINILRFLPKAAKLAAVSFQNYPPFSPGRDKRAEVPHRPKTHLCKGSSGPYLPMIPAEARTKSKSFETAEPTSPKISCMGQIKHRKMIKKQASMPKGFKPVSYSRPDIVSKHMPTPDPKKKQSSGIKKMFKGRKSDASADKPPLPDRAPSLSQMRRFASSRDTLASFDWTSSAAQVAPEEERGFYSDEEGVYSDGEDDVMIPFSAPMLLNRAGSGLEAKKEINLWKRRTMSQPKPLNINVVRAQ